MTDVLKNYYTSVFVLIYAKDYIEIGGKEGAYHARVDCLGNAQQNSA